MNEGPGSMAAYHAMQRANDAQNRSPFTRRTQVLLDQPKPAQDVVQRKEASHLRDWLQGMQAASAPDVAALADGHAFMTHADMLLLRSHVARAVAEYLSKYGHG